LRDVISSRARDRGYTRNRGAAKKAGTDHTARISWSDLDKVKYWSDKKLKLDSLKGECTLNSDATQEEQDIHESRSRPKQP
jgi:hypothetical protein